MNTFRIALAPAAFTLVALTAHCAGSPSTPQSTVSVPAGSYTEPATAASSGPPERPSAATPLVSGEPPPPALPPMLQKEGGICSAFDPVKSADGCGADGDCAPAEVCHARSCAAASKAPKKAPGTMCTMNLVCQSIDVGRCACVDKVCALVPR